MPSIISDPTKPARCSGGDRTYRFGYYERQNKQFRDAQEDALVWHTFENDELSPREEDSEELSPLDIGKRLWTNYQLLDKPKMKAGTTASTTIYNGKGYLITATLGDAAAFAVVYSKKGTALGVKRLNAKTHKPTDPEERSRILATGGYIPIIGEVRRVNGILAISRAIGDDCSHLKASGVCSAPSLDIIHINQLVSELGIEPNKVGSVQIITTCDGFTDGAGLHQTKQDHENYLYYILKASLYPGSKPEIDLTKKLVDHAIKDGSQDNVTVAIQSITKNTPAFFLGVYDGHGGSEASIYVANHIIGVFQRQCGLSSPEYSKQRLSATKLSSSYERDNRHLEECNDEAIPPSIFADTNYSSDDSEVEFEYDYEDDGLFLTKKVIAKQHHFFASKSPATSDDSEAEPPNTIIYSSS